MRWDNLFDDLESQLEQGRSAEEIDLQIEEERLRLARLGLRDRLRSLHAAATTGAPATLQLVLRDASRVAIVPATFGRDWFMGELVEESGRRPQCIIPLESVGGIVLERGQVETSLDALPDESAAALSARLGMPFILRDLCRRRTPVDIWMTALRLHGTIDRVGRDHIDLAIHEPGQPRRESLVREYRILRLTDVLLVRLPG